MSEPIAVPYPGFTVDVSSNKALADSLNRCVDPGDPLVNKVLRALATQAMAEVCCAWRAVCPGGKVRHGGNARTKAASLSLVDSS
jgi:DIS3-like exonuclease 1